MLVVEIRDLINELRKAEFKAGVLHHDAELSERKNKITEELAARLDSKLTALEEEQRQGGPAVSSSKVSLSLKPSEILAQLGFNVPEEGVKVSRSDYTLHLCMLRALGTTMNVQGIPDESIRQIARTIAMSMNRPVDNSNFAVDSATALRQTMTSVLKATYGRIS
jgi:hypothetical protein